MIETLEAVEQAALVARDEFSDGTDRVYGAFDCFARAIRQIIIAEKERTRRIMG